MIDTKRKKETKQFLERLKKYVAKYGKEEVQKILGQKVDIIEIRINRGDIFQNRTLKKYNVLLDIMVY